MSHTSTPLSTPPLTPSQATSALPFITLFIIVFIILLDVANDSLAITLSLSSICTAGSLIAVITITSTAGSLIAVITITSTAGPLIIIADCATTYFVTTVESTAVEGEASGLENGKNKFDDPTNLNDFNKLHEGERRGQKQKKNPIQWLVNQGKKRNYDTRSGETCIVVFLLNNICKARLKEGSMIEEIVCCLEGLSKDWFGNGGSGGAGPTTAVLRLRRGEAEEQKLGFLNIITLIEFRFWVE
ncbi:hypothetical protein AAF712_016279, partial [Marasmius tenuissimus]